MTKKLTAEEALAEMFVQLKLFNEKLERIEKTLSSVDSVLKEVGTLMILEAQGDEEQEFDLEGNEIKVSDQIKDNSGMPDEL